MQTSEKIIVVAAMVVMLSAATMAVAAVGFQQIAVADSEDNPAHDSDNGNGNEGSLGQCKQEANNDNACTAKFP